MFINALKHIVTLTNLKMEAVISIPVLVALGQTTISHLITIWQLDNTSLFGFPQGLILPGLTYAREQIGKL